VIEVLAPFDEGSLVSLVAGPCLELAFLLRTGREVGICLERGLVLVEACVLSRTGEACGEAGVSGFLMGEPFGEDSISSITGGPCFMVAGETCELVGMVVW